MVEEAFPVDQTINEEEKKGDVPDEGDVDQLRQQLEE